MGSIAALAVVGHFELARTHHNHVRIQVISVSDLIFVRGIIRLLQVYGLIVDIVEPEGRVLGKLPVLERQIDPEIIGPPRLKNVGFQQRKDLCAGHMGPVPAPIFRVIPRKRGVRLKRLKNLGIVNRDGRQILPHCHPRLGILEAVDHNGLDPVRILGRHQELHCLGEARDRLAPHKLQFFDSQQIQLIAPLQAAGIQPLDGGGLPVVGAGEQDVVDAVQIQVIAHPGLSLGLFDVFKMS